MENVVNITDKYRVKLAVFEGPLDLLLYLIKKNEIDITDIPISLILDQYLEYLTVIKTVNFSNVGEFILMAATLAYIKSQMLLPKREYIDEDGEYEDPRNDLVKQLIEYQQYRNAAETLRTKPLLNRDVFKRGQTDTDKEAQKLSNEVKVELYEIALAFYEIVKEQKLEYKVKVNVDEFKISDSIKKIKKMLKDKTKVKFRELFTDIREKSFFVATFLAILEMTKNRIIRIRKEEKNLLIEKA